MAALADMDVQLTLSDAAAAMLERIAAGVERLVALEEDRLANETLLANALAPPTGSRAVPANWYVDGDRYHVIQDDGASRPATADESFAIDSVAKTKRRSR